MRFHFYTLLTIVGLLATAPAQATNRTTPDSPAEIQRKTAARAKVAEAKKAAKATRSRSAWAVTRKATNEVQHAMLVVLGLEESRAITSPAELSRQLHANQRHLRAKAMLNARARRARAHR